MNASYLIKSIKSGLLALVLLAGALSGNAAENVRTDKALMSEPELLTSAPTARLATALTKAWNTHYIRKGGLVMTNVQTSLVDEDKLLKLMGRNQAEAAIVTRGPDLTDTARYWATHSLTHPKEITIAGSKAGDIKLIIDSAKMDRWEDFVKFCQTHEAQEIVEKLGLTPLPFDKRA